jgi:FkbM family methyltransferase
LAVVEANLGGYRLVAYGGNAEDVVLMRAFADRPGGFFVDVGAGEPVSGSLTKNMVDRFGWRGVNIEPLPERFQRLRAARPNDVTLSIAIGDREGAATFYRIVPGPGMTGGGGLSTLDRDVLEMHLAAGWRFEELQIEIVPLENVLNEHAEPGFDLLKIDVEGAEASVLASVDLEKWRPRAIVVEATVPLTSRPSHQEWEPGVLAVGYELALFDGLNRFYARHDEPQLLGRLSVPANVLDRYIPFNCAVRAGLEQETPSEIELTSR